MVCSEFFPVTPGANRWPANLGFNDMLCEMESLQESVSKKSFADNEVTDGLLVSY